MVEYIVLAVLILFFALIVFSIILNARDMKWFVDFTEPDAKEKFLALGLDDAEIRRYRRRRSRFGRFGGTESLSDYVQIPLDAPLPKGSCSTVSLGGDESLHEGKALAAAKAVLSISKGVAMFAEQNDLLLVFGRKDGKEHKIYSCDFTADRLELSKEVLSVLQKN